MPSFLYPEKLGSDLASELKKVVTRALVTAESHIRTPDNAETVLGEGVCDLVSIVRGQIADPFLAMKARKAARDVRGLPVLQPDVLGATVARLLDFLPDQPVCRREFEWGGDRFVPSDKPKTVLVIGAGPAGLEAARASAERGHRVILCEASDRLGGQFRLAGLQRAAPRSSISSNGTTGN